MGLISLNYLLTPNSLGLEYKCILMKVLMKANVWKLQNSYHPLHKLILRNLKKEAVKMSGSTFFKSISMKKKKKNFHSQPISTVFWLYCLVLKHTQSFSLKRLMKTVK